MAQNDGKQVDLPTRQELPRLFDEISRWTIALERLDEEQNTTLHTRHSHSSITAITDDDRYELQTACESLAHATQGASRYLLTFAQSHRPVAALQYAVHFRLACFVPREDAKSISYDDLAASVGVPAQQCQRAVRMLITCDIFQEPAVGRVAHNTHSRLLMNGGMEAAVGFLTDETFRATSCLARASAQWRHAQLPTSTPFNLAFNTDLPMFLYQSRQEPWRAKRFSQAMTFFGQGGDASVEHLIHGFEWTTLAPGSVVVDVGGSSGHCMRAVATVNRGIYCIVQDIEANLSDSTSTDDFDGRIRYVKHDFFAPQTCVADVYLLRWILHDYPDDEAVRIIKAQVSAMKPFARLLIMENILPGPGARPKSEERDARLSDIGMWALLNGRERDNDAWVTLFRMADSRLRVVNTVTPRGSALSIIELQLSENSENHMMGELI